VSCLSKKKGKEENDIKILKVNEGRKKEGILGDRSHKGETCLLNNGEIVDRKNG